MCNRFHISWFYNKKKNAICKDDIFTDISYSFLYKYTKNWIFRSQPDKRYIFMAPVPPDDNPVSSQSADSHPDL